MTDKIFVFFLGAIVGSFLNVCIHRLPKKQSIVAPGSHCPNCVKPIKWHDNIPVISYLALKGRCRFCGTVISPRYPAVELLTAILTLALFTVFGPGPRMYCYAVMFYGLIISTFVDFEIQEIPDEISIGGTVAGLVAALAYPELVGATTRAGGVVGSIAGAAAGAGLIYLMGFFGEMVFKKEAMGGGDVKLMAMIGAFLGWKIVTLVFFMAPVFGAAVGIILKLKDGREIMPYGPYLSLAAVVAVFWGNAILNMLF